MASYGQTVNNGPHAHQSYHPTVTSNAQRRHVSKQRFYAELSQCLYDFVIQLLPTTEEMAVKEDVRRLLERLIRTIEPNSRLLSFGSTANGFSLRNSGERWRANAPRTVLLAS
jgi:terminal uridylyltransferase